MSEMNADRLYPPELQRVLEALAADAESASVRRRAQILLRYQAGQQTSDVAAAVGLSRSQVRHWRRQFRERGMGIFPAVGEPALIEPPQAAAPVSRSPLETEPLEQGPLTLEALRTRYNPALQRAQHVRATALALFDRARQPQPLTESHRRLLAAATFLHDLAESQGADKGPKSSQALILEQPLEGFTQQEQRLVAAIVRHQKGAVRRRALAALGLNPLAEQELLALIGLLRLALGLDASHSQTTEVREVIATPHQLHILVDGPHAENDAAAAEKNARLWARVCHQEVRVVTSPDELDSLPAAAPALPFPEPQKNPGVEPWDPMSEAGRKILRYHFAEMLRHEEGTRLGEDIEALHDMRVATRRMRAAFEVFAEAFEPRAIKPHLKGLRATGRALGRVRDLDVFMEKAGHHLEALPESERHSLDPLLDAWRQQREGARERMLDYLDGERYQRFKVEFNVFLATPGAGARTPDPDQPTPNRVQEIAPVLIYNCMSAVRAFEAVLDRASIEQLHALRIEFKKLRYTVEFFKEVLGDGAREVIADIKKMQDHLGDLNDADVACQILRQFLENWEDHQVELPIGERQNPEPVVAYLAAKHAERHHLMVSFPEVWAYFSRPAFRQNLALAIATL